MSATSVLPMCVRTTRGLLRLMSGAAGASSPATLEVVRAVSTNKPPDGMSSATGGLAQAILQERLQQQQSQVTRLGCLCALDLCLTDVDGVKANTEHNEPRPHEMPW